jgi:hypothetical protein
MASGTDKDRPFYRWFLIILSLLVLVMSIISSIYYKDVLDQYNAQPDVQQDIGQGWAQALYGLNIALAVVSSLVLVFQVIKAIWKIDVIDYVVNFFTKEKTAAEVTTDVAKETGASPEAVKAAGDAAAKAKLEGATDAEAAGAAKTAAEAAGAEPTAAAKVVAYIAGSPKRIAAYVKEKFAKDTKIKTIDPEDLYCGAPIPQTTTERKDNKTKIDLIKKYEKILDINCSDNYSANKPLFNVYYAAAVEADKGNIKGAMGIIEYANPMVPTKLDIKYPVNKIKNEEPMYCGQPEFVVNLSKQKKANECVNVISKNLDDKAVSSSCDVQNFQRACIYAKSLEEYKSKSS